MEGLSECFAGVIAYLKTLRHLLQSEPVELSNLIFRHQDSIIFKAAIYVYSGILTE